MRHRLTRRAESDLKDIYRYTLGAFGAKQAETYLRELDAVFELLGDYPNMGRPYDGRTRQSMAVTSSSIALVIMKS